MYIPASFAQTDLATLHDAIERYSFGLLVSGTGPEPMGSHLPLLIDRAWGSHGTLLGHMARPNVHWQQAEGQPVLAIFSGPHAYISPRWYEVPQAVPTWNYVAVHAYGRLEVIDDEAAAAELLQRTVKYYEAAQPEPWEIREPPEFIEKLMRQIVAFRIPIDRLEGKWKLNQNRPLEQRRRVVERLEGAGDENSRESPS